MKKFDLLSRKAKSGTMLFALAVIVLLAGCGKKAGAELLLDEVAKTAETERIGDGLTQETTEQNKADEPEQKAEDRIQESMDALEDFCYVHICGAVVRPGVYKLAGGSRIYEAVELAGGFTAEAAESYVNQAGMITDGMKVVIPSVKEAKEWNIQDTQAGITLDGSEGTRYSTQQKVNLNTASVEELCTLTGIGESRAGSIIAYREQHGGFSAIEEIMQVEGIKEGAFAKIKDKISVQ